MADLGGTFDANGIDPATPMEPLPAGKYLAMITESEMKDTKAGTGKYLKLTFQIVDGPHKNKKCWAQLNVVNSNPVAAEIARKELSAIAHAVGVLVFRDSAALHDIPLCITVKCEKRKDNDAMGNSISGYEKKDVLLAPPAVAAPQATTTAPPWQR